MNSKEYKLPNGKKAVFEYDNTGVGKITLECMDELMAMVADRPSAVDLSSVYSTAYKSGYEKGKADRPQGDTVSRRYLLAEVDDLADEFSEVDENGLHSERWCGILDSKGIIVNAPSVSDRPQEWIPCSERLPEVGETVLTFDGYCICIERRIEWINTPEGQLDGEWWIDGYDGDEYDPINLRDGTAVAWMPLPKPYKENDDRGKRGRVMERCPKCGRYMTWYCKPWCGIIITGWKCVCGYDSVNNVRCKWDTKTERIE